MLGTTNHLAGANDAQAFYFSVTGQGGAEGPGLSDGPKGPRAQH